MTRLQMALDQITFARRYTERLLAAVPESDWFRMPPGGVSHTAWQVGHLATAQYRLALERMRGRRSEDDRLISPRFLDAFKRESIPGTDATLYPSPTEIRKVFDQVHAQVMVDVPRLRDEELDEATLKPHLVANTKFASLLWCAQHELVHAGQIGLLRRQLGQPPLW
jgi:hypothetical protein